MKQLAWVTILASLLLSTDLMANDNREITLCGALKERFMFQVWSMNAPDRDPQQVIRHPQIETTEFRAGDGKIMRGYKYQANGEPEGYLLAAMGNAMVSDDMIIALSEYAEAGYDVYVYDYRGYADSDGRRRLKAILKDYQEMINQLSTEYERALLYGISFGGIVMMNAIGAGVDFDAAVIDSSPSTLSDHGCPESVDPIRHLSPDTADRLMIITGDRDSVLRDSMTAPLRDRAEELGARIYQGADFGHPFMDRSEVHDRRTRMIREHLLNN
ncbi:hypothetical protein CWE09_04745 [Aliidiomarina minuta]|uniref:Serine aminopeptidase S33 domain-containing protein n=1 Tax=Aliidiomarina minuta TaxID=880057 RepID=A0A432W7Q1_9GAMM|nr:alpha/beta hydrolase [Aliidiomarina minuta]RUO26039.1 hypothetical protein CWE09_04745 [Aliidiomarina minuta]